MIRTVNSMFTVVRTAEQAKIELRDRFRELEQDLDTYRKNRTNYSFFQWLYHWIFENEQLTAEKVRLAVSLKGRLKKISYFEPYTDEQMKEIGSMEANTLCGRIEGELFTALRENNQRCDSYKQDSGKLSDLLEKHLKIIRNLGEIFEGHLEDKTPISATRAKAKGFLDGMFALFRKRH